MALTTVLFDIDGTLVDSNDAHAHAWVEAFAAEGVRTDFATVRQYIGMGGDKVIPAISGLDRESPQGDRIARRRADIFKTKYLPRLQPLDGASDIVAAVKSAGLGVVAASSAEKPEIDRLLDIAGVTHFFEAAASSDDADESKPDPDIIQGALKKAGVAPAAAILIGDTPYDVEAGRRAGVPTIAFRTGGWSDQELSGAVAIYDGPRDLLAQWATSPLCVRR
jgi:HAD superfamily hydrolase (TIGR01509 family)